jgi:hypothetical protein
LSSIGLVRGESADADVLVMPGGASAPQDWRERAERGIIAIFEGESTIASSLGFRASAPRVAVQSVEDLRAPKLRIIWEKPVDLPRFEVPTHARIFARERHSGAPLMAGFRLGAGAVLWVATAPGPREYDRFPYLPQALAELGLEPPFRSARLWAFFDGAYRSRVDLDYFAPLWRRAGISALHVAAWHYWERDAALDAYLQRLIDACHRNAIQVYAWFELPHVSELFWDQHPEWREKTALLQDAQLDWRKLINLTNRDAFAAVSHGLREVLERFDWDGVNLAELYFESLEGHDNPARFTPMHDDVRRQFRTAHGFDPVELFQAGSPRHWTKNGPGLARFLDFRADLARRQQQEWIGAVEDIRKQKPHLDLVLTHIDDRFDSTMRDKLGADTARTLPLLNQHDFTFLIEDPATIWHLGPQRYPQIAEKYRTLTPRPERLAIDVNVVERYQDVYPTKQQTGIELFSLLHLAARAFPRVALYFESSIPSPDLSLLSAATSDVSRAQRSGRQLTIESRHGAGVPWTGAALVDGRPWPVLSSDTAWLPAGTHIIQPAPAEPPARLLDLNGDLKSAAVTAEGLEFSYETGARAYARFNRRVNRVEIDGAAALPQRIGEVLVLPRGQHIVRIAADP